MNYRKQGLRALGLSFVAVLGLMAFMAAGAQAAEGKFLYLVGAVTTTLAAESEPVVSAHTHGTLLIPGKNLKILCPKVASDPGAPVKLLGSNLGAAGGIAHGHLIFKECESFTISTNVLQGNCTPKSPGAAAGEILAGGLAELILHPANTTLVLFKPLVVGGVTQPFVTIVLPELCALAETSNVTGELIAECGKLEPANTYVGGSCSTHRTEQLLKEIPEALRKALGFGLKFGANEASVDGIAAVKFGAPCAGCSWGADAL
jgi:hypothetical protein